MNNLRMLPCYPSMPLCVKSCVRFAARIYLVSLKTRTQQTLQIPTLTKLFIKKTWLNDSIYSQTFALFRAMNCKLGNRFPILNNYYSKLCSFCSDRGYHSPNTEIHLLISCPHFQQQRYSGIIGQLISYFQMFTNCDSSMYMFILDDTNPMILQNIYVIQSELVLFLEKWNRDILIYMN